MQPTSEAPPGEVDVVVVVSDAARAAAWVDAAAVRVSVLSPEAARGGDEAHAALAGCGAAVIDADAVGTHSVAALLARLHRHDPAVQMIVGVSSERQGELERALLYAPGVGEVWIQVGSPVPPDRLAAAAEVTARRRRFERTRAQLAIDPASPTPRVTRRRASEAFLAGLLRIVPDPVFAVDGAGRVQSANDAGLELFAAQGLSIETDTIWTALPGTIASEWLSGALPTHDATYESEVAAPETMGPVRSYEVRIVPVRAGAQRLWAVVARDLSDRVRAQRILEEQAAELEAQAAELTEQQTELERRTLAAEAAMANERKARADAERASAAAQRADTAKSEFLAMMSHELRTPINGIVGYAQLLEVGVAGEMSPAQVEYLHRLRRSTDHLLSLVNDVLDLAKIDAAGMTTADVEAPTGPVVADALNIAAPLASARGVRLFGPDSGTADVTFVGDPDRVRQVLVNLISNAVKFTEAPGEIRVSVGRGESAPPGAELAGDGPWTYFRVADTGIGIPADKIHDVFEPFVQVESGRTRTKGGTGLGLAISRRLARLMGGDLTLESTVGKGSTFTLWLPALHITAGDTATPAPPAETAAERVQRARQVRADAPDPTLADLGMLVRRELSGLVDAWLKRIRSDPEMTSVAAFDDANLADHTHAMLADIAQSLVIVERTGGLDSPLLDDSSAIQRVIATHHGRQRRRLGFTESQVVVEYRLLSETLFARMGQDDAPPHADARLAAGVLTRLLTHARSHSIDAFRAARSDGS